MCSPSAILPIKSDLTINKLERYTLKLNPQKIRDTLTIDRLMNKSKRDERRKLKRFSVRLKVYSQETNEVIGYTNNLHTEGMMMMSMTPLPKGKEIKIWFGTNNGDKEQEKIFLTVYRVWSSFTEDVPRLYCSGLHYDNPSYEALDKIQGLIDDLDV